MMHTHRCRTQGFTLIEMVMSLFVLSFGIIAVAGLQLNAMRLAQQAHYQSIALAFASELVEIMRMHPHSLAQSPTPFQFDLPSNTPMTLETDRVCFSPTTCNEQQSAQSLITQWQQRLRTALPNARSVLCRDHTPWHDAEAELLWECDTQLAANYVLKIGWSHQGHPSAIASDPMLTMSPHFAMYIDATLP